MRAGADAALSGAVGAASPARDGVLGGHLPAVSLVGPRGFDPQPADQESGRGMLVSEIDDHWADGLRRYATRHFVMMPSTTQGRLRLIDRKEDGSGGASSDRSSRVRDSLRSGRARAVLSRGVIPNHPWEEPAVCVEELSLYGQSPRMNIRPGARAIDVRRSLSLVEWTR